MTATPLSRGLALLGSSPWRLRPGDWLVLALGAMTILALLHSRHEQGAGHVVIKRAGVVYAETDTRLNKLLTVPGPLGDTVVEIRAGRVRVQADPSPRQLCVAQGWLAPGEAALCLPNRVSVEWGRGRYDSLNY